jgi:replication factor C subunit 2/4
VLELNASNERGIQVVRDKVKQFAQSAVKQNDKMPTFKLIILDEADSMTADAQSALRRTMETYSKITRFCLICNYVSRIIEPLASRCAKFRFKPLPIQSSLDRLQYIAEQEHAASTDEGLQAIIDVSEGDLRKAITILQSASRMTGGLRPVDAAMVREIAGIVPQSALVEFVEAASAKDLSVITDCTRRLMMQGYSGHQFLSQVKYSQTVKDFIKSNYCSFMISSAKVKI